MLFRILGEIFGTHEGNILHILGGSDTRADGAIAPNLEVFYVRCDGSAIRSGAAGGQRG